MANNENETQIIITVELENGKVDCSVIDTFEINKVNYIALMPLIDNANGEQEIQLFRYNELNADTGIEIFTIQEDTEFEKALEVFEKRLSDDENNV